MREPGPGTPRLQHPVRVPLTDHQRAMRAYHAVESSFDEVPVESVATGASFVDNADMVSLRLNAFAQSIDICLQRSDLAQQFHVAHIDRVRHRDRLLVNIQTDKHSAIVVHAGLRAGNRRGVPCAHRAALAVMLTRV